MSRRTAIVEEEFDDDVDLPLPARPLPNLGTRGAILEEIGADGNILDDGDEDEDEEDAPPLLSPQPTAGPASPTSKGPPVVTDITPYKHWTCVYPIYIDAKQPYGTGTRRIPREKSVWWPLSKDIADASNRLGLGTLHEVNKMHPRDWDNPGRVRVQWKKDGRLVNPHIKSKKQLLEMISITIQRLRPDNTPKAPYIYPEPAAPPTSTKPAKSKSGSSKSSGKAKSEAKPPAQSGRPLPTPPDSPPLASRISPYSPALSSGVLIDTVKAGMSAPDAGNAAIPGAGASGKGKRKVLRVRG